MAFNPKDFEDDEDFKKFIADQISTATSGLVDKRDELLGDITKLKKQLKNTPNAEKLEELQAAEKKLAEIEEQQLEKNGEYQKLLDKAKQQYQSDLEKKDAENTRLKKSLNKHLVDGALATELSGKHVNPLLSKAAIKLLSSDVSVIEENDEFVARVGDKSIEEYVAEWTETDVGKNFILADGNGGGGHGGGGNGGSSEFEQYFDPKSSQFNMTKQVELYRSNPKLHGELKEKFNSSPNE